MPVTVINTGENICDVAIREYGHIHGIYNLIKQNSIGFTSDVAPGTELVIDSLADFSDLPKLSLLEVNRAQKVESLVEAGQNIFDLALQQFGSIEGILNIVKNNGLSFSSFLTTGALIDVSGAIIQKPVHDFFKAKSKPAHGSDIVVDSEPVLEGIGYWAIEVDFIVS